MTNHGFSTYKHLLSGVLPTKLKYIKADNEQIIERFFRACIGWIRYKPLLLYITDPDSYDGRIQEMKAQLAATLPNIRQYFGRDDFMNIATELEKYDRNVKKHYEEFSETKLGWQRIIEYLRKQKGEFSAS